MSKRIISAIIMAFMTLSTVSVNVLAQEKQDNSNKKAFKPMSVSKTNSRKSGQLIIKFKENSSVKSNANSIIENEGRIIKSNKNGLTLIEVDDNKITEKIDALKEYQNIEYIVPNYTRRALGFPVDAPNDPDYKSQWGLDKIKAQQAWSTLEKTSSLNEVKVAVIDTGLDMRHEDLKDRVSSDGYDFVDMDNDPTFGPVNEEHASHVAGIIAASTNNGVGVSGTSGKAPVKIMPLRVLEAGSGDDYTIAQAICYAADNGARVINMSLGGPMESPALTEAVNYALSKNVAVVAAAGNNSADASNFCPASIPGVITVSATDDKDALAEFSNYGSVVELAAPGVNILSTIPGNKYEYFDGTSMSTPFVSAACALLISRNPSLTNIEVEQLLTDSSKDLGDEGKDGSFGYGLLDLDKALTMTSIKPRLEIVNLSDNATVFDVFNVQTRFTYPQNIVKTDVFIDNSVVQSIYNQQMNKDSVAKSVYNINMFNSFEIDSKELTEGTHNLKVVARDKTGQSYSKEIGINVRNTIYTGLRVRLTHDDKPVNSGLVEVWSKYTEPGGKIYYDNVFSGRTSKNGLAVIPGSSAPNGNQYVIVANYSIPDGDGEATASLVKEVVAPGMIEMDGKDLVPVTVDTGLRDESQAVFANYKFPGSNQTFQLFLTQGQSEEEHIAYLNPGTYSFEAVSYNSGLKGEEKKSAFILKTDDIQIDSGNFLVTMDSNIDNLAKINLSYENIHGFLPKAAFMSVGHTDSVFSHGIQISDFNGITEIYTTPGSYSYNFDIIGEKDGQIAYVAFGDRTIDLEDDSEEDISIGGIFTGKITTDKTKFIPGEDANINASVTDSQGNKLLYMDYMSEDPFEGLLGKNIVFYKNGKNKVGFKVAVNSYAKMEEPVEIEYKTPVNIELVDGKNNIIESKPQTQIDNARIQFPQNLETGNYKIRMVVELPYLIQSEKAISVSREIKKDGVKFNIELPGKLKAKSASIKALNMTTGVSSYCYGEKLLNGEMYIALPKGTYKFIVSTNDSKNMPVIYIKDAKAPAEYSLTSNQLQNTKFTVKDEEEKTINKPTEFYLSMPVNGGAYTSSVASTKSSEAEFYISKGTYNFSAEVSSPDTYTPERIVFNGNTKIGLKTNTLQSIDFTSDKLTEVSLDSKTDIKKTLAIIDDKNTGLRAMLYLTKGKYVKVSKGQYDVEILCSKSEYGEAYTYDMTTQKDFSSAKTYISCGTDFSISATPNKANYKAGETLKTENVISDRYGNRVVGIMGYNLFGYMSEKIKSSKGQLILSKDQNKFKLFDSVSKEYIEMPDYDIRAPFMQIKDSFGDTVFTEKNSDYYTKSQIKLDPIWALSGNYKIELTVDIDADGNLSAQNSFRIK